VLLALGFAALSWTLPVLFPAAKIRSWIVRGAGVASALVTPLIATREHDMVVNVAAACGAVTLVVTMITIRGREGRAVLVLGLVAFATAALNFVLWRTGYAPHTTPLVQKGAFAFFLAWVLVVALRIRALLRH
jgi:hypothetical protein